MRLPPAAIEHAAAAVDNHAATCDADGWECCVEVAITAYLAWVNGDES